MKEVMSLLLMHTIQLTMHLADGPDFPILERIGDVSLVVMW